MTLSTDELTEATSALAENILKWLSTPAQETIASIEKFGLDGIPANSRGHLIADKAAMQRFSDAFFQAVRNTPYNMRISHSDAYREFKKLVSKKIIYGGEAISKRNVSKCFNASIETCAAKAKTLTRYIACNVVHGDEPTEIVLGAVRFIRSAEAMEIFDAALRADPDQNSDLQWEQTWAGPPQKRIDALRTHYRSFDWVAEVKVEGFDLERSVGQSYRLAQCALDFLHLLVGAPHSDRMRLDWNFLDADRPATFALSNEGELMTTINYRSTSRHLGDGWWEQVKGNAGDDGLRLFGIALERANTVVKHHALAKRYVDALTWYGDAVREKVQASRLLKFTMSIELLLGLGDTTSISKRLSRRGASILFVRGYGDLSLLYEAFLRVYDARSDVVHGSTSPRDFGRFDVLVEAEDLSRSLLLEMLSVIGDRGFNETAVSTRRIKRFYDGIEERAVGAHGKALP